MVRFSAWLLPILIVTSIKGQNLPPLEHHQFICLTLEDLTTPHLDTFCQLRKIDDVRVDSLVKRCWFSDGQKGMIKNVSAVAFEGNLYFQEQAIRSQLPNTFHPNARKESNCFYPALERGRYLYFEILSEDKDPELSVAMGIMAGTVGNAFGTAFTPPQMNRSPVVFDTNTKVFSSFDTWKDIELFMHMNYPNDHSPVGSGQLDHAYVRQLFAKLNQRQ